MSALAALEIRELNKILLDFLSKSYFDTIYPIGSIYISTNNTDPKLTIGGTWKRIEGRFLIGASANYSAGSTGGNATHSHTAGSLYAATSAASDGDVRYVEVDTAQYICNAGTNIPNAVKDSEQAYLSKGTAVYGNTTTESNMPPYLAVYMWERIA